MKPGMTLERCMQLLLDSTLLDNRSGLLCDTSAPSWPALLLGQMQTLPN